MSFQAVASALKASGITPTQKLVLICLANYANADDECWPSYKKLSEDVLLSKRQIMRVMSELEALEFLETESRSRANGAQSSNMIRINIARLEGVTSMSPPPVTKTPEIVTPPSDTNVTPILEPVKTKTRNEPINRSHGQELDLFESTPAQQTSPAITKQQAVADVMSEFDIFWKAYPKKTGDESAKKAFAKVRRKKTLNELLEAIERSKRYDSRFEKRQFTPAPSKWLNEGSYNDQFDTDQPNRTTYPQTRQQRDFAGTIQAMESAREIYEQRRLGKP